MVRHSCLWNTNTGYKSILLGLLTSVDPEPWRANTGTTVPGTDPITRCRPYDDCTYNNTNYYRPFRLAHGFALMRVTSSTQNTCQLTQALP